MKSRAEFAQSLATKELTHEERAIALLWFYRESQEFDERTAGELAADLHDEGFPKPNVSRLGAGLRRSRLTTRGSRQVSFKIDVRRLDDLRAEYGELAEFRKIAVADTVLPSEWFKGTRPYLEKLAYQINGSYEYGFYDGCAALCRRLMETLIIDVYVNSKRHHEIQRDGVFLPLDQLIKHIQGDKAVPIGRNSPKTYSEVKQIGDTAAHDRVYITNALDIDDVKQRYRTVIQELLELGGYNS